MTQSNDVHYLITGTYTGGKSEGIYVFEFNSRDGSFKPVSHVKISNPSFVAVSPDEKFVFAVNENSDHNKGGEASSFVFDKQAFLSPSTRRRRAVIRRVIYRWIKQVSG